MIAFLVGWSYIKAGTNAVFVSKYETLACEVETIFGVPADLCLAQAILESGNGTSRIAKENRNFFGIRIGDRSDIVPISAHGWHGEFSDGYRCYSSDKDCFYDYGRFMSKHYPKAVGRRAEHWLKWCRGYGGKGYWSHVRRVWEMVGDRG
jgi:flagellum-specific peptidoglycan hydrolase FlgJ